MNLDQPKRYAMVRGLNCKPEIVSQYLPSNYQVEGVALDRPFATDPSYTESVVIIGGRDNHGWTLDRYVIPRLASGLMRADEIDLSHPVMQQLPAFRRSHENQHCNPDGLLCRRRHWPRMVRRMDRRNRVGADGVGRADRAVLRSNREEVNMPTIQLERDDELGFHVVICGHANTVLHITNSVASAQAAVDAAIDWLTQRKDNRTMKKQPYKPVPEDERKKARGSNEDCPRFIAYVSDSYVESSDSLDELIEIVKRDGLGCNEDCAIFADYHHLAAVILTDGSVYRFNVPPPTPAPSPQSNGTAKLKAAVLKKRRLQ